MSLLPGRHKISKSVKGTHGKFVFCIAKGGNSGVLFQPFFTKYSAISRPCASQGAVVENRTDLIGELIVAMTQPRSRSCVLNHLALPFQVIYLNDFNSLITVTKIFKIQSFLPDNIETKFCKFSSSFTSFECISTRRKLSKSL